MLKRVYTMLLLLMLSCSVASANALHDIQDSIPADKMLHFGAGYIISDQLQRNCKMSPLEAFLTTTAIAWAKEKWIDSHVDNGDAYSTMAGSLFYITF